MKKLHLLLVNNYAARGGIPKAVSSLANAMAAREHKITILSHRPVPKPLYPAYKVFCKLRELSVPKGRRTPLPLGVDRLQDIYPLADGIEVIPFTFSDKNLRVQKLRQKIKTINPDVCVVMLPDGGHLVWAVTLLGTGVPYIYSEHHSPATIENIFWSRKGRLAAMSGADAIHLLLPSYLDSLPENMRQIAQVIPNTINLPEIRANVGGEKGQRKKLLWMARLQEETKQCRLAMDAFALIADKFPDWDLHIAGDGPDRKLVKSHHASLAPEIAGRIKLLGHCDNPISLMASAQAFCFSSKTEGMPITLLEVASVGLPCVAFSGCDGVGDIIRHKENGLLASEMTAEALAAQLSALLSDPDLRKRLGDAAREGLDQFSEKTVYDNWEKLLYKAAARKGGTAMDAFAREPFASLARLSSCARREWLWRDFGDPMPYSLEGFITYFYSMPLRWFQTKILGRER